MVYGEGERGRCYRSIGREEVDAVSPRGGGRREREIRLLLSRRRVSLRHRVTGRD
jgi:hypothetical protein